MDYTEMVEDAARSLVTSWAAADAGDGDAAEERKWAEIMAKDAAKASGRALAEVWADVKEAALGMY